MNWFEWTVTIVGAVMVVGSITLMLYLIFAPMNDMDNER